MGDKHVLMHQNHGPMVTGGTVAQAFYRLYFLEQAARIVNKALALGRPLRAIPDQVNVNNRILAAMQPAALDTAVTGSRAYWQTVSGNALYSVIQKLTFWPLPGFRLCPCCSALAGT